MQTWFKKLASDADVERSLACFSRPMPTPTRMATPVTATEAAMTLRAFLLMATMVQWVDLICGETVNCELGRDVGS